MASRALVETAWRERLERFAAGRQTVDDWCAREGVTPHQYRYWRRRLSGSASHKGLEFCNRLFGIERGLHDATPDERRAARLIHSRKALDEMREWPDQMVRQAAPKGATASAVIHSIVETAQENGLSPAAYLQHLFEQLPNTDTQDPRMLDQLLPWSEVVKERCAAPTTRRA